MTASDILLVSAAPLDAHTAGLLRDYTSDEISEADGADAATTLREWSRAARVGNRLVLADADLRAEANALANLLDDPRVLRVTPAARARAIWWAVNGTPATGSIGLGVLLVSGRRRVPRPPTSRMASSSAVQPRPTTRPL